MRIALSAMFCAVILLVIAGTPRASRDHGPIAGDGGSLELIVFETPACAFCPLFRRDVLPRYRLSPRARTLPMRFVNLDEIDPGKLDLHLPLRVIPTIVLMRDGTEVDRIGGYIGPELFFDAVTTMLNRLTD